MISTYDKALSRLKTRRNDNSAYAAASKQVYAMSNAMNKEQQSINSRIGYLGNSLQAQIGARLKSQKSISDIYNEVFSNATENQNARNAQIDDKIENITMARDAAIEQEKKEKKAKSENLWKTGITTAATLAGSLIPGGGLIAPAIGSAVGNLVAGSGILDVTGDADPQMLMQGASDVFKSAANIQSTFTNKRTMQDAAEFMSGNMKRFDEAGNSLNLLALPKEQQELFKSALATGKWDTVYGLMGKPRPKMRMGDFINTDYWSE